MFNAKQKITFAVFAMGDFLLSANEPTLNLDTDIQVLFEEPHVAC
jgi:hypothetical protein